MTYTTSIVQQIILLLIFLIKSPWQLVSGNRRRGYDLCLEWLWLQPGRKRDPLKRIRAFRRRTRSDRHWVDRFPEWIRCAHRIRKTDLPGTRPRHGRNRFLRQTARRSWRRQKHRRPPPRLPRPWSLREDSPQSQRSDGSDAAGEYAGEYDWFLGVCGGVMEKVIVKHRDIIWGVKNIKKEQTWGKSILCSHIVTWQWAIGRSPSLGWRSGRNIWSWLWKFQNHKNNWKRSWHRKADSKIFQSIGKNGK